MVTEAMSDYCGVKVKSTSGATSAPSAPMRCRGEEIGHVTTAEHNSQMLSLGGVRHLTEGGKRKGAVVLEAPREDSPGDQHPAPARSESWCRTAACLSSSDQAVRLCRRKASAARSQAACRMTRLTKVDQDARAGSNCAMRDQAARMRA